MISIFFSSILCHLKPKVYDMILLVLNYLEYHVGVLQIDVLLERKHGK